MNGDEELDRAVEALRTTEAEGPAPRLKVRTLAALARARRPAGSLKVALRLAAAVAVVAGGVGLYLALRPGRAPQIIGRNPVTGSPTGSPPAPKVAGADTRPSQGGDAVPGGESRSRVVEAAPPREPDAPRRAVAAAGTWSITGLVRFEGEPLPRRPVDMSAAGECARHHPGTAADDGSFVVADGKLANVVVSVRFADGQDVPRGQPPAEPAHLDQEGCQYHPHVLAMRVGQPIVVSNSDPLLHNVHALTLDNPAFNFGQPTIDPGRNLGPMKAAEAFKVKCDFHPWMLAYVHVFDHPFYAVTKEDGAFAIPAGLPDGRYTLVAWHERLGERKVAVNVKGGKAEGAELVFESE